MYRPILRAWACLFLCSTGTLAYTQAVGINYSGAAPHPSAMLDISNHGVEDLYRGLLIPRVSEAARNSLTLTPADNGMWVYQQNNVSTPRGFYYWHDDTWHRWSTPELNGWSPEGNAITNSTTQFLGSTNTQPLIFRAMPPPYTGGSLLPELLISNTTGRVSLGATNGSPDPVERLEVGGAIRVGLPIAATPEAGTIAFGALNPAQDPRAWHYAYDGARWSRLQNAETIRNGSYAFPDMICTGQTGNVLSGPESGIGYHTPGGTVFPTGFPGTASTSNAYRVHHLYKASELSAAGLCGGPITSIGFYSMDNDSIHGATPVSLHIRIRVYAAPSIPAFTNNLTQAFHGPTLAAPVGFQAYSFVFGAGWVNFPLSTPVNYTVGDDIMVDVEWVRTSMLVGNSPRVLSQIAGLPFTSSEYCTRWTRPFYNSAANPTTTFNLNTILPHLGPLAPVAPTLPSGVERLNRPVLRIGGNVKTVSYIPQDDRYIQYSGGIMVGDSAWAANNFKGPGTLRAQHGVYDGFTQLSDHVFDRYFTGQVKPEDATAAEGFAMLGLPELQDHLATHRHLPDMPSRAQWETKGSPSLGELHTGLWRTVETQALYIMELEKDLSALEASTFGNTTPTELESLRKEVQQSRRLSEAQKIHLLNGLQRVSNTHSPATR